MFLFVLSVICYLAEEKEDIFDPTELWRKAVIVPISRLLPTHNELGEEWTT